jgi:plastocyanin
LKTLYLSIITIVLVVSSGTSFVFAQNDTSQILPSPPAGKYPYSSKIFSIFSTAQYVHPNEIATVDISVTNNADFPLFDLNVGDSFNDSKYVSLYALHKIDILEPNETKTISGQMYVHSNVKPTNYFDVWWNIVAKNETGNMMESTQFHRDLVISQNDTSYGNCCQDNTLAPPLQQVKHGKPVDDVSCRQSLQFVKRAEDGAPACIKPESMVSLVNRGWAKNPLSESGIPADKQRQLFDVLMNFDGMRNWSKTGWKYMGSEGRSFPNGTSWNQFDLYLPPGSGSPKIDCNAGWHAWLTFDGTTMQLIGKHYPNELQQTCGETQYPNPTQDMPKFDHMPCDRECKMEKESSGSVCYPMAYDDYYCITAKPGKSIVIIPSSVINPLSVHNNFIPEVLRVKIGVNNTVEWYNEGTYDINVIMDNQISDSGSVQNKWLYTFDTPGTYTYHGQPYPWLHGEIIVKK